MESKRARVQFIVNTRDNWYKSNPVLLDGEIGLEKLPPSNKSNYAIKIGDGITDWNHLPYIAFENAGNMLVQSCTQAEYDAMEKHDEKTVYYVTDEYGKVHRYLGNIEIFSIVETTADDYIYIIDNNSVKLIFYKGTEIGVKIPSEIEGKPVTEIESTCFTNSNVKYAVIPETVEKIY